MQRNAIFSKIPSFFMELIEKEKGALAYIEHVLESNSNTELVKIINELIKYPGEILQKFYRLSLKFRNFCQKNAEFHKAILNGLKNTNNLYVEIISMDDQENISFFDMLVAVRFFDRYEDKELPLIKDEGESKVIRTWSLNKACEIGLYDALVARCNEIATQYLADSLSEEEKCNLEEAILADLNRLCNLYWGVGYLKAGSLLREYASKLCEKKELVDKATAIYEEGIRKTLCASFLEANPYSEKIEKCLLDGKGFFAKRNDPKCRNWDDYKMQLCQWSGSNANYERLYNFAKQEIEGLLQHNRKESKLNF